MVALKMLILCLKKQDINGAVAVLGKIYDSTKAEFKEHASVTESVAVQTATEP